MNHVRDDRERRALRHPGKRVAHKPDVAGIGRVLVLHLDMAPLAPPEDAFLDSEHVERIGLAPAAVSRGSGRGIREQGRGEPQEESAEARAPVTSASILSRHRPRPGWWIGMFGTPGSIRSILRRSTTSWSPEAVMETAQPRWS